MFLTFVVVKFHMFKAAVVELIAMMPVMCS